MSPTPDLMWPGPENRLPARNAAEEQRFRRQRYPSAEEVMNVLDRNPEAAAPRGLWGDLDFLRDVYDRVNPLARTHPVRRLSRPWLELPRHLQARPRGQSARRATAQIIAPGDPEKFRREGEGAFVPRRRPIPARSVHMMDIHAEKGMQCADCHFAQDSHGNGLIYGEVANAIEIGCKDCHGTADAYANLRTSGPAAPPQGTNLELLRNEDGRRRFEWIDDDDGRRVLIQRSIVDPELEWEVQLVKDTVDSTCRPAASPASASSTLLQPAARAKLMSRDGRGDRPLRVRPRRAGRRAAPTPTRRWPASPAT